MKHVRDKDIKFDLMHVIAHRAQKEKAKLTLFELFVTETSEAAADWLAKGGDLKWWCSAHDQQRQP